MLHFIDVQHFVFDRIEPEEVYGHTVSSLYAYLNIRTRSAYLYS